MTKLLIDSIPWGEIPHETEPKPNTIYFFACKTPPYRPVTIDVGETNNIRPDAFVFWTLMGVMDYVFNNLEENQPSFDHTECHTCSEWLLSDQYPNDDTVCLECYASLQDAKDTQETEDFLYLSMR